MGASDLVPLLIQLGIGSVVLLIAIAYVLLCPEKAQTVAGWLWGLIGRLIGQADKKAVAYRVQGEINSARASLLRNAPADIIEGKLRIDWTNAEAAEARARGGDVVVFMRRSRHHDENVAHALMAYLPKAVLPRARRYVGRETMRAAELTLAKAILTHNNGGQGALDVFYEEHLDPAKANSGALGERLTQLDEIDLQGWLVRVLLVEYRRLGELLYPGDRDTACTEDAEQFALWLHGLAKRSPGDRSGSLAYNGRFLRVAIIFVADRSRLLEHGVQPYRQRAKRYIYQDRFDAVYLMGRDHNIPAVEQIVKELESDGRIRSTSMHEYTLRADFTARKTLNRERAVIACLRRRQVPGEVTPPIPVEDAADLPSDTYTLSNLKPAGEPEAA